MYINSRLGSLLDVFVELELSLIMIVFVFICANLPFSNLAHHTEDCTSN